IILLDKFVRLSEIADEELTRANAGAQFESLEKLLKIAAVIQTLKLPGSQLDWLFRENPWLPVAPDPPANPSLLANWFSIIRLQRLRQDLTIEDAALEAILGALSAVAAAQNQAARLAAKSSFIDSLAKWLGWPREDLETLIGRADNLGD